MEYEEFVKRMKKHKVDVSLSKRTKDILEHTLATICLKNVEARDLLETIVESRVADNERAYLIAMVINKSPFSDVKKAWSLMDKAINKIDIGITLLDIFEALAKGEYQIRILENEEYHTEAALTVVANYLYINKILKNAIEIGELNSAYDGTKSALEHILNRFKTVTQKNLTTERKDNDEDE